MQRRRPGIEQRLAIRLADRFNQVVLALEARRQVVVVLHAQRNAKLTGPLRALLDRGDNQVPLRRVTHRRMLIPGEDAHQLAAQIPGQPRQLRDVLNLHFALRDFSVLQVRCEIVIAGDAQIPQLELFQLLSQPRPLGLAVIERAQVRAFGHQHHAVESQLRSLAQELLDS